MKRLNKRWYLGSPMEKAMATTRSNEARARAEASFREEERVKEGAKVIMEYQANSWFVKRQSD